LTRTFIARSPLPVDATTAFAWHERPGAFERLSPPWAPARVVRRSGRGIEPGSRLEIRTKLGPLSLRWVAEHGPVEPGRSFRDEQLEGPFASWRHEHRFLPGEGGGSTLEDRVEYALPLGPVGDLAGGFLARASLRRLFARRHAVTAGDLERHARVGAGRCLRVAVTGATGLIGSALCAFLSTGGHRVVRVVRSSPEGDDALWDPAAGQIDAAKLEGLDAVVHLAGENIAGGRWTPARKRAIRESRVRGTRLLAEALARLERPPGALVCASAVGYYGSRGTDPVDETAGAGRGFLPETCLEWEGAAEPASARGIRVAHLRLGVVLAAEGGALEKMLLPFRLGGGGPVGSGRQGLSWVALDDVVGAFHFVLMRDDLAGAFNVTAPEPVAQKTFARTLGRVMRRPALVPLPAFAVRALFGEMGERLLLEGAFVRPGRLTSAGFGFRWPALEPALRFELGRMTEAPEFRE
jgi:uncharacterized protein (TIGR01777 family)